MRSKILISLIAVTIMGGSSAAMAHGSGGVSSGGGKGGSSMAHGHRGRHFGHRFLRNPVFFGDGWGWPYGEGGYTNTTVVIAPRFPAADLTGSVATTPCHWNAETFSVPSSAGGNRPVELVSCR